MLFRLRLIRLGREWKTWAEEEIATPRFIAWQVASNALVVVVTTAILAVLIGEFRPLYAFSMSVVLYGTLLFSGGRRLVRERTLEHHRRKWSKSARNGAPAP